MVSLKSATRGRGACPISEYMPLGLTAAALEATQLQLLGEQGGQHRRPYAVG